VSTCASCHASSLKLIQASRQQVTTHKSQYSDLSVSSRLEPPSLILTNMSNN